MGCRTSVSNFERKKAQMLTENRWKSNFVRLWLDYGAFTEVDGEVCFAYYRIDGPGEGQQRMSKLLKQPELWQETQDPDLEWVHLVFKLENMVGITSANISSWLADYKTQLDDYTYDHLKYTISNSVVTAYGFYDIADVLIDDDFLSHLAFLIASRKAVDTANKTYDAVVTPADVKAMMDTLPTHTFVDGKMVFDLPLIRDEIASWMMANGLGTSVLDQLVLEGKLVKTGDFGSGLGRYYLPLQTVKEMGGHQFLSLVTDTLDFDYKEEKHWYDFFLSIIKPLLAAVAIYFGLYMLAVSLMVSSVADLTDSKVLKILSTVIAIYAMDVTSIESIGASEAAKLLANVYGLYMELKYKPETGAEDQSADKDQEMFYKAPYSAFNDIYCYGDLISVTAGGTY